VINTQTNALVGSPITVGANPVGIAITPNGSRAYVTNNGGGTVSVINTQTNAVVGSPIAVGTSPRGIAITPDGSRAYVANNVGNNVSVINTQTNTAVGTPITLGGDPFSVAITPNQPPRASLSAPGEGLSATLDGGGSTDDERIASYEWDFGDGSRARTTTPTVEHAYTRVGEFTAKLTVSDGEGCRGFVYTGQTALCNGPSQAAITRTVATVELGKLKRKKRRGTAVLTVEVPGPGELTLTGKGVAKRAETVDGGGAEKLKIKAKGKRKRKLNKRGKAKVNVDVAFTMEGADPNTQTRKIKLVKRR
jgi:YVTN family beta-propeller protein